MRLFHSSAAARHAAGRAGARRECPDRQHRYRGAGRFIVKLRAAPVGGAPEAVSQIATHAGLRVLGARHIFAGMHLLQLAPGGASAAQTLARLRADPQVEYAEPDQRRHALAAPDDPLFSGQWYMQDTQPSADG
jgi:hypothetical protein